MAKILVADDNSNIQKMVGLALKDQGIDVVAVGNGEAAVRKISDIRPDLVLADVFMPVRNGYEVCKYVKDDPSLAHIPVILLVGAFDPLDEQEAQRVGADGVLKKPFVPPDPLISMVKSALARAGVLIGAAAEEAAAKKVEAEAEAKHAADMAAKPAPRPSYTEEEPSEEIPVGRAPVSIDRGSQPLAFGSLLETSTGSDEDEPAYAAPSPSMLRPERDWKMAEVEEEAEEEEDAPQHSWRPGSAGIEEDETPAGKRDWREAAFSEASEKNQGSSAWAAKEKVPELVETGPSAYAPSSETPAPAADDTWSSAVAKGVEDVTRRVAETREPEPISVVSTMPSPEPIREVAPPEAFHPKTELAPASETNTWMSVAPSPWDAEVQKASKLAATWDSSVAVAHEAPPAAPEPILASLPTDTQEVIREEAAHFVEEAKPELTQVNASAPAAAAPNVDDIVAKVLSKMDPAVLQAMTRELLKPVVESIVREELQKK